jgi:hypothetical protein
MWKTIQVEDLATLSEESTNVSTSIHGVGQDVGMVVEGLGLPNQTTQDASKGHGLFHSTARRRRCKSLQVERQVMLDWSGGLHRLHFQSSTDVGEAGGSKGKGFRVVLLPMLILGTQVKRSGMLQVRREYDSLVTSLTGQLYAKIPSIERDEGELGIAGQVLLDELVEASNGITERTSLANMFPSERGQGSWG